MIIAGYAVETPRLLLNSASALFPDGLANSSGMVGRCFMVHTGEQAFARFSRRINQYKAPPPGGAITEHFNGTMPDTDFVCGYSIEVVGPHPADTFRITSNHASQFIFLPFPLTVTLHFEQDSNLQPRIAQ